MSGPTHWYRAYGLRIRSAAALPFDPLPDPGAFEPDVTVRLGAVPETLPACNGHSIRSNRWQARPGAFLMRVEDVARYLVTGGRDMLIDPLGTDDGDVVAFFTSSPFTALLQQRGVATLHAAAVATEAGAVMLLGRSGIGKSSLAAALVERGYSLLVLARRRRDRRDAGRRRSSRGAARVRAPAAVGAHPGRDALARAGAVEGAAGVGEVLGAVATGLRRAAAGVRRLRAGSQRPPGHRHRARVARQRLLVAVEKHPPPAGDERDGTTPRAFPRRHRRRRGECRWRG